MCSTRVLVLVHLTLCFLPSPCRAQDSVVEIHDKPVAVMVNRVTERDVIDYFRSLSQKMEVGEETLSFYDFASRQAFKSTLDRPVGGTMLFLTKGLIPSVTTMRFYQLADEQEYAKRIAFRKRHANDGMTIEGAGTRHKTESQFISRELIPDAPGTDDGVTPSNFEESTATQSVTVGFGTATGPTLQFHNLSNSEIVEEDGKKYRQTTYTSEQYLKYNDQLMYSGDSKAVWDAELPGLNGILSEVNGDFDLGAEIYLERVPVGLRTLGWSMLSATLGTQMQKRDDESDYDYELRSSSGKLALAIARAAIFDAQHIHSKVTLADEKQPLLANLAMEVSSNSALAKQLADLSSARSRFAPIVNDGAAMTLHTAFKLPPESEDVIRDGADWLQNFLITKAGADADLVLGGLEVAETLGEIADHNNLEMFLKFGWTEESGAVIYGGLQVDDNPQLLKSLLAVLAPQNASDDLADRFATVRKGELDLIEFAIPNEAFGADAPVRLTHAYLAHVNSCLWFCAGGKESFSVLQASIDRCQNSGLRANARVLTAEIDVEKWLSYPSDDETGLTRLPLIFDQAVIAELVDSTSPFDEANPNVDRGENHFRKISMQEIKQLGGQQIAKLHVDTSKSGFRTTGEVGKAFGNYFIVRWLQAMDIATGSLDIEELERQVKEKAAEAESS